MFEPSIMLFGFTIRTYPFLMALAILISFAWLLYHTPTGKRGAVFDTLLGGLVGGLLLARLVHVGLNWRYFTYNIPEITNWTAGGLDWRGAVVGSIFGMALVARWRNPTPEGMTSPPALSPLPPEAKGQTPPPTPPRRRGGEMPPPNSGEVGGGFTLSHILDHLTLMLPVFALAGWWGCGAALCAYGVEVQRMADYPAFMTWEAMDAFGIVAPRFQTQAMGVAAAVILFGIALILMQIPWLAGRRFWLVLMLLALTMFAFGFLRGDYALHVYGIRVDMVLDVIVALWAGVMVFRAKPLNQAG